MIPVHCHTNLDLHPGEEWPIQFAARPVVGDIIVSRRGLELQVVQIRWKSVLLSVGLVAEVVDVELHLVEHRFESISAFDKWYKNTYLKEV